MKMFEDLSKNNSALGWSMGVLIHLYQKYKGKDLGDWILESDESDRIDNVDSKFAFCFSDRASFSSIPL